MSSEVTQSGSVSYTLSYKHGVDPKRRVQVPAKWRNSGEAQFTLVLWPGKSQGDTCLMALPPAKWEALKEKLAAMPYGDPKADGLRRYIGTNSEQVTTDSAGRINIPEPLAAGAGLTKDALFVGMVDRFQIWDPERYKPVQERDTALADDAFSMI